MYNNENNRSWINVRLQLLLLAFNYLVNCSALRVYPPLIFVDENFEIDAKLPVQICGKQKNLRIRSGDEYNTFEVFKINDTCSGLKLKKGLDADIDEVTGRDYASYSLIFEADRQQASLDIQVVDINDNPPVFKSFPSVINLSEKTPTQTDVATVRVFDPDTGLGGLVDISVQSEKFAVDTAKCSNHYCTAALRLIKALDYETQNRHSIVLVARDGARRIKRIHEARLSAFVNVIDEQDMPPVFITDPTVEIQIPEDKNVGKKVYEIKAEDGDRHAVVRNRIRYDIKENKYFDIDHNTGALILKAPLDRENLSSINITVIAVEQDEYKMQTSQNFSIVIVDSDDEIPRCEKALYNFVVTEGKSEFERSELIIAMDDDEKENAQFYVKLSGKFSEYFTIEPTEVKSQAALALKISNASGIDYETTQKINLKLELLPKISSSTSGSCSISIKVNDENDNPPKFANVSTTINVTENKDPHFLAAFLAQELDSDTFLPILYRLSGSDSEEFSVDENGRISSRKKFDREDRDRYHLTLEAIDNSGRGLTSTLNITVNVLDENDNRPMFEEKLYTMVVDEETVSTSFNVKAVDIDTDENGRIKYSLISNELSNIEINEKTGTITVGKIDAEKMPKLLFNVTLIAEDCGIPPLKTSVPLIVEVKDINDHTPKFENSFVLVDVDQKSHGQITYVNAMDGDKTAPNNLVKYRIITKTSIFNIDHKTGDISITQKPDGSVEFWKFTVIAEDGGTPPKSAEAKVFVQFKDREKIAFVNTESVVHLSENATVGSIVFVPKLLNELKNLTFEINELNVSWIGNPSKVLDWLAINESTGVIQLAESIDADRIQQIHFVMLVKNHQNKLMDRCKVTVMLDDINDNSPTFVKKLYTAEIVENAPIGREIITVEAVDPDRTDYLTYSIQSSNGDNRTVSGLHIDNTGRVTVNGELDYERTAIVNCTVVAVDSIGNAAVTNLSISILDANDNRPVFLPSSHFDVSISESAMIGTLLNLSYPLAYDKDSGTFGEILYSLIDQTSSFTIDNKTSQIFLTQILDYEKQQKFNISVRAVDNYARIGFSNEAFATITINILDVNDNPPVFVPEKLPLIKVDENEQVGNVLAQMHAKDADSGENAAVKYLLLENSTRHFTIDEDGNLRLAESLSGKIGAKLCSTVEAKDSGDPALSAVQNVCIMVIPTGISKNIPLILWPENNSIHYFDENKKYSYLFTINATTGRSPAENELRYGIVESYSQDWKSFIINSTGTVFAKQIFDFERQKLYELRIEVCDFSDNCLQMTVFIAVNDLNDHCPEFKSEKTTFSIKENEPIKKGRELVGVLTAAQDLDASSKHRNICYMVMNSSASSFFFYDKKKPELYVSESLDREQQSMYELTVVAYDCNNSCSDPSKLPTSNTTVIIDVIDVNDNFPKFRQRIFHAAAVQGRTEIDGELLTVVADDPDVEEDGLHYEIKDGLRWNTKILSADHLPLYINSSTGKIFSNKDFRMDESASLNFHVTVTDSVGHQDDALVSIAIISYEQQLELLFDAPSEVISQQLTALQKFLSVATGLTAVVDTVFSRTNSTVIMAHFLDQKNSFVTVQDALRNLNKVELEPQKKAKQALLNKFGLRKAEASKILSSDDDSSGYQFTEILIASVVAALLLILIVLLILCCRQKRRHFKRLRTVAAAADYASAAGVIARTPPRNQYSKNVRAPSKPLWKDGQQLEDSATYPQQLVNTLQSTEL